MPKITFRGQTYNSEFEMPEDLRQEYQESERRNKTRNDSLRDVVDMTPEVRAVYERALNQVEEHTAASPQPARDLPRTEDIYRQSAPEGMKHLPSDESVYRPSDPVIDPTKATIEPEPILSRRLISSVVWAVVLAVLVFIAIQYFG